MAEVSAKESANNYKREITREERPATRGMTLYLHVVFTFSVKSHILP